MTLTVACVSVGTKYDDRYVHNLKRGVQRFMPCEHEFVCFGDRLIEGIAVQPVPSGLSGWWAKLALFAAREPMIYFDLDMVITGDLTRLVEWDGFGITQDCWVPGCNSSVMKLTGNERRVWDECHPGIMQQLRGDQDWINVVMPDAPKFPRAWFPVFKADGCVDGPTDEAMAVNFHGFPKPAQITSGWVPEYWN